MPIELHSNTFSPPSRAVQVLVNHLNLTDKINVKTVDLQAGGTRTPEFLKLNPAHSVPTLVEDNGAFVLSESRAILPYLVDRFAPGNSLYPSDIKARAQVNRILFFDASSLFPSIRALLFAKFRKQEPTEEQVKDAKDRLQIITTLLGDQKFLTGNEVTIADISVGMAIPGVKFLLSDAVPEKLQQWYARLETAVPALKKLNDTINYAEILAKVSE